MGRGGPAVPGPHRRLGRHLHRARPSGRSCARWRSRARASSRTPTRGSRTRPARARLLELLAGILPAGLTRVFFTNSGAEANDAAVKLARKATGRTEVIATEGSFHGRTISMVSATGQAKHRDKFRPQMPGYRFVPYGRADAVEAALDDGRRGDDRRAGAGRGRRAHPRRRTTCASSRGCAAPTARCSSSTRCRRASAAPGRCSRPAAAGAEADFLTMAKGIAGGFPLGAFAMTEAVAARLEAGDHGGTYCGNPLACAVARGGHPAPDRRGRAGARRGAGRRGARAHELLARALPERGRRRPRRRPAAARRVPRRGDGRRRRRRVPAARRLRAPDPGQRHPRVPGADHHARGAGRGADGRSRSRSPPSRPADRPTPGEEERRGAGERARAGRDGQHAGAGAAASAVTT